MINEDGKIQNCHCGVILPTNGGVFMVFDTLSADIKTAMYSIGRYWFEQNRSREFRERHANAIKYTTKQVPWAFVQ